MRLIDADALVDELFERLCADCDRRKGIKNGKWRIIYNVGDAPCRACEVGDVKAYLEDAPTADAVPVVRCGECVHRDKRYEWHGDYNCRLHHEPKSLDFFCSDGQRREGGAT